MKATVADRGQVTIPKALRDSLGIGPRTVLEFRVEKGRLIAEKADISSRIASVRGVPEAGSAHG